MVLVVVARLGKCRFPCVNQVQALVHLVGVHPDGFLLLRVAHVDPGTLAIQSAVAPDAPFRHRLLHQFPGLIHLVRVKSLCGQRLRGLSRVQVHKEHLGVDDVGIRLLLTLRHPFQVVVAELVVYVEGQHESALRLIHGMVAGLLGRPAVFLLKEPDALVS